MHDLNMFCIFVRYWSWWRAKQNQTIHTSMCAENLLPVFSWRGGRQRRPWTLSGNSAGLTFLCYYRWIFDCASTSFSVACLRSQIAEHTSPCFESETGMQGMERNIPGQWTPRHHHMTYKHIPRKAPRICRWNINTRRWNTNTRKQNLPRVLWAWRDDEAREVLQGEVLTGISSWEPAHHLPHRL